MKFLIWEVLKNPCFLKFKYDCLAIEGVSYCEILGGHTEIDKLTKASYGWILQEI